jgi:exopolysaccharide biosynthesis polyprenyl glycosylphosphotransferase
MQTIKYVAADILTASVAWVIFNVLRYYEIASYLGFASLNSYMTNPKVWIVQFGVPLFWLFIYYFSGYYNKPLGKSKLGEFFSTLISVVVGVTVLFFVVILNDLPRSFEVYYTLYFSLLGLQFALTYMLRLILTLYSARQVKQGRWAANVLIIGEGDKAKTIASDLSAMGYNIAGFANFEADFATFIADKHIDEIVVAMETADIQKRLETLYRLYPYKCTIKVLEDKSALFSKSRLKTILGLPLVDVSDNNFSEMEKNIKLWSDRIISIMAMLILSPLMAYIAIRVRRESSGPAIFKQERIGYGGKPFMMYKFRTMYVGAESESPLLAKIDDARITPFGRIMRKYRLDELPQFWNVLKGDMSFVGPRPERKYFIEKIVQKAPYYYLLHNVRPGITSLGMVKYGYASNVDEMVERLEYDMIYYENMSLLLDMTILVYTVKTVITGKGI